MNDNSCKGIATKFASEGANVAFTYLSSEEKARELEKELQAFGIKAKGYQSNAGELAGTEALVEQVLVDFGNIDIVVNNAGITKDNFLINKTYH